MLFLILLLYSIEKFHNKSLDSELVTHVSSDESAFFYTSVSHSILFFSII